MKKHILAILYAVCFVMALLLGNLFVGYPSAHAHQVSKQVTYTWHRISSSASGTGSATIVAALPHTPNANSNCLGIAMTINPGTNSVQVIMGISNQCGTTIATIRWEFTSTAICGGQAYSGPSGSGSIAQLANGVFVNVANDHFTSDCLVNGVLVAHTLSFTGTAEGAFPPPHRGNTASGREDVGPITIP
jgi:hypothetical protein